MLVLPSILFLMVSAEMHRPRRSGETLRQPRGERSVMVPRPERVRLHIAVIKGSLNIICNLSTSKRQSAGTRKS
jgi:hypothetical protein